MSKAGLMFFTNRRRRKSCGSVSRQSSVARLPPSAPTGSETMILPPNPYQARAVNRQKILVTEVLISVCRPQNGNSDLVFGLQVGQKQPAKGLFELNRAERSSILKTLNPGRSITSEGRAMVEQQKRRSIEPLSDLNFSAETRGCKGVTRKVNTPERPLDTGVRLPHEILAHGFSRNSFDRRLSTSE